MSLANIWRSYEQEYGVLFFFDSRCIIWSAQHVHNTVVWLTLLWNMHGIFCLTTVNEIKLLKNKLGLGLGGLIKSTDPLTLRLPWHTAPSWNRIFNSLNLIGNSAYPPIPSHLNPTSTWNTARIPSEYSESALLCKDLWRWTIKPYAAIPEAYVLPTTHSNRTLRAAHVRIRSFIHMHDTLIHVN